MSNYYAYENTDLKIKKIKKHLKDVLSLLDNYDENDELSKIDLEDIDKISSNLFGSSLSLLSAAEQKERECGHFYDEKYKRISMDNVPISIEFENEILSIKTPLTLKRSNSKSDKIAKENYMIQSFLAAKIAEFKEKNPNIKEDLFNTFADKYLVLYIIRYSKSFSQNAYCDNDNLENKRVQNAICQLAGVSDRADKMDLHICFRTTQKEQETGMKFLLVGYDEAPSVE